MGLANFVTMTNNIGLPPIVIKGGVVKSINQYYNKKKSLLQSELKLLNNKHWSNRLDRLTAKRNNKINDFMHKSSRRVVNYCIENRIDTLIVGKTIGWKQIIKSGKKNNQNFVQVPIDKFISMLKYKCENAGIIFVCNEESYTSKASFLDSDSIPVFSKDKKCEFSGRRVQRGMYESKNGVLINADVNGSYNIMVKAIPNAFADGIEGVGLHPMLMKIA